MDIVKLICQIIGTIIQVISFVYKIKKDRKQK